MLEQSTCLSKLRLKNIVRLCLFLFLFSNLETSSNAFISLTRFNPLVPNRIIEGDTDKIFFHLYPTKRSLRYREELVIGDPLTLESSSYNKSKPVVLLIHGFISEAMGEFEQDVKNAYLDEDKGVNVIAVEWRRLATPKTVLPEALYSFAVMKVPLVGKKVSEFLNFLVEEKAVEAENIHLVGHSLGAHVSGKAGRYFQRQTGKLVGRITGLDPAGPVFVIKSSAAKLDSGDAQFVDIIHSNGGMLGYFGKLGHIDFFPNGGSVQPNCSLLQTGPCDHSAAYKYFAKSIRDKNIVACKCEKYFPDSSCLDPCLEPVTFGEYCPPTARGNYYLKLTYEN